MRLDKFLKVSRLIKRRTVANEACDAGRVLVNGNVAKASVKVKVGDIIEIQFGTKTVKVEVLAIQETTQKEEAKELFKNRSICILFLRINNKYIKVKNYKIILTESKVRTHERASNETNQNPRAN